MTRANVCLIALLLLAIPAAHGLHMQLDDAHLQDPNQLLETLPSVEAIQLISLGYDQLAADYYWLRSVNHFGDKRMHKYNYPNLVPLMQRVIGLDPYFASAYVFAGYALTLNGMDWRAPAAMLEQGHRLLPNNWNIAFLAGFVQYYFLQDFAKATTYLSDAARLPGVPDFVGPLAIRLAAEAGEPEVGLQMVDAMISSVEDDPVLLATYMERHNLLTLEIELRDLQRASNAYKQAHGTPPPTLQALVGAHLIDTVPDDPLGGAFELDAAGHVTTLHESARLRLAPGAKVFPNAHASD